MRKTAGYGGIGQAFAELGDAKVGAVGDYVEVLLEALPAEEKLLLFAHHHSVLDKLEARVVALGGAGPSFYVRVDGQTPIPMREEAVSRFQDDPDVRVALLSITACGVGLSFTAASTVVFGELIATPGAMAQAEDRVHRVGQRRSVDIHYLVAPGTIDDSTLASLARKREELRGILASFTHQSPASVLVSPEPTCRPEGGGEHTGTGGRDIANRGFGVSLGGQVRSHCSDQRGAKIRPDDVPCQGPLATAVATSARPLARRPIDTDRHVNIVDEDVGQLVAMGFEAARATAAWEAANGSMEQAVELLTKNSPEGHGEHPASASSADRDARNLKQQRLVQQTMAVAQRLDDDPDRSSGPCRPRALPDDMSCQGPLATGMDAAVAQLVAMGFEVGQAKAAWEAANGSIELAIELACRISG